MLPSLVAVQGCFLAWQWSHTLKLLPRVPFISLGHCVRQHPSICNLHWLHPHTQNPSCLYPGPAEPDLSSSLTFCACLQERRGWEAHSSGPEGEQDKDRDKKTGCCSWAPGWLCLSRPVCLSDLFFSSLTCLSLSVFNADPCT